MGSLKQPSPFKEVPNITTGDTVDQAQTGRSAPEILDEIVSMRDVELFDPDKAENVYDKLEAEIADLKAQLAEAHQRPERPDKAGQPTVADLIAAYERGNPADDHAVGLQGVAELVRRETAREICLWIEDTSVPLGDVPVCEDEDFIDLKAKYGVTE